MSIYYGRICLFFALLTGCAFTPSKPVLTAEGIDVSPFVLQRQGLGLTVERDGFFIGWLDEVRIVLPDSRCQVVIVTRDIDEVQKLLAVAGSVESLNNICVVRGIKQ